MSRRPRPLRSTLLSLWLTGAAAASCLEAQTIRSEQGVDPRVDYVALAQLAPWDDRNYQLTQKDLALLSSKEDEIGASGLPVFYRVELHRAIPKLGKGVYYPKSALQSFFRRHGGYLYGGVTYSSYARRGGRYVLLQERREEEPGMAFRDLTGDVRITTPVGNAESAIEINPTNQNLVIAGSNMEDGDAQQMHFSSDGGETWTDAAALPLGNTCCDPTIGWSSDGTLAYTATLGNCGSPLCSIWFYRSSDNGQTWDDLNADTPGDPRRELTSAGISDKEYLHVDHSPNSSFLDRIYLGWHDNNTLKFARSSDSGTTWSSTVSISSGSNEAGIGNDITSDRNGNVYYIWPAMNSSRILVRKSTNGGTSFASTVKIADTEASFDFPIPAMDQRRAFIYVSADADLTTGPYSNRIYAAWTDSNGTDSSTPSTNHARIQVAFSSDGGATWTVKTPHSTSDIDTVDRFHPWLAVDSLGYVHVIFYDTRQDASRTKVDIYHSVSTNGGANWSTQERLTSVTSPAVEHWFEFGDYNGLDVVGNLAIGIYTDNRNEGGGSADSIDVYGTAASTEDANMYISLGTEDGRIYEDGDSGLGDVATASDATGTGLRVGDNGITKNQYRSILSFNTSGLPDNAKILSAQLRIRRGGGGGSMANLGSLVADVKTGGFGGNTALAASDFEAAATVSASCTLSIPAANEEFAECFLSTAGKNAISSTGTTQIRIRMTIDDDDDIFADYVGFYGGEAVVGFLQFLGPQLIITYEPPTM